MAAWLDAIMSPLNAAGDVIEKLIKTRDLVKFGDTFRKLLSEIIAAQRGVLEAAEREAALQARISELQKELTRFETWDAEAARYEMKTLSGDTFVMMLKPEARGAESPHWLCMNCFNDRKKSPFQYTPDIAAGRRAYQCHGCGSRIAARPPPQWI
jgi:hypothetical protein